MERKVAKLRPNVTVLLHQFGVDAGSVDTYETTTDARRCIQF